MLACGWYYMNEAELVGWSMQFGVVNDHILDRYLKSVYWTVATMMAVGYGDSNVTVEEDEDSMWERKIIFPQRIAFFKASENFRSCGELFAQPQSLSSLVLKNVSLKKGGGS